MRTRVFAPAVFVAALMSSALAAGAYAQSLGELAKKEEARRKAITGPAKVYTNESLRSESRQTSPTAAPPAAQQPAAPPSASGAAQPSPSGQAPGTAQTEKPAADPTAPDPKQDEAAWRKRIQNERELLQRAQTFAEALQSRINALTADFSARDDPAQRAQIGVDRQKALAELDRVQQEIQQHTKAIASIQEDARKAGVPPGWVR